MGILMRRNIRKRASYLYPYECVEELFAGVEGDGRSVAGVRLLVEALEVDGGRVEAGDGHGHQRVVVVRLEDAPLALQVRVLVPALKRRREQ